MIAQTVQTRYRQIGGQAYIRRSESPAADLSRIAATFPCARHNSSALCTHLCAHLCHMTSIFAVFPVPFPAPPSFFDFFFPVCSGRRWLLVGVFISSRVRRVARGSGNKKNRRRRTKGRGGGFVFPMNTGVPAGIGERWGGKGTRRCEVEGWESKKRRGRPAT